MAFGLGFDKAKILQAAEKYVIQGKIPAAIEEYQKIIKKDPKDLMTLNAIGDLYVRVGKSDEALATFNLLAEKSVEAGMVPRAIAVYKRITKLDPESLIALEKLGELYSMQGLMRDSRTYYLQAVDIFVKRRDMEKARVVFERVLMLDMDNPKLLKRMGDLYVETRKESEAVSTYISAVERFLDGNEPDQALAVLDAIYRIDPINVEALTLKGRALLEQGKPAEAIAEIEAIRDYQQSKSALNTLFHAYSKVGDLAKAEEVANLLLERHDDIAGLDVLAAGLLDRSDDEGALAVYQRVAERLQARGGLAPIADGLRRILDRDSKNKSALELLWKVYRQIGDVEQGRQTGEQLAHLALEEGEPVRAREIYSELAAAEPDNYELAQQLRRIDARYVTSQQRPETSGNDSAPLMAIEDIAESGEASSHVGGLPPREQALVKNCITESELYLTYHQVPKAIETLENGLLEVPGDIALYEHVLPLYEQSQEYAKAMKAAEALTESYVKLGDGDRASRYGELLLGYQAKLMEASATLEAAQMAVASPEEVVTAESVGQTDSQVREVDLSMEWDALSSTPAGAASTVNVVEEIDFYLQAGLPAEAEESITKLRAIDPNHSALADYQNRLDIMLGRGATVSEVSMPEWGLGQGESMEQISPPSVESATDHAEVPHLEPMPETVVDTVSELAPEDTPELASEPSLHTESRAAAVAETVPQAMPVPALATMDSSMAQTSEDAELDLAPLAPAAGSGGFELALEDHAPAPIAPAPPTPAAPSPLTAAPVPTGGGLLDDLFAEFRDEVETPQPGGGGDLETHYNMGVAFKEMALYDEAIGEFQKVHQIAEQARDYSHLVQCCSLLALCFIEKGLPLLAVNWYQTALNSPGTDADTSLALLYEIGSSYELAGDRQAALKSYMDVYSRNIDYRNVSERIRELQQGS